MEITKIVTHRRPHPDDILGVWLFLRFKHKKAGFGFVDNNNSKMQFPEGTIAVGVGRGEFDEHPSEDNERKNGECAATLVAKHLGIDEAPELKKLLMYICKNDLKGSNNGALDVAVRINSMYNRRTELEVVKWAFEALDDLYEEKKELAIPIDFERIARVFKIRSVDGGVIKIASVISDSTGMTDTALNKNGVDVFIQRRTSGNVQIFFRQSSNLDSGSLARVLRIEENLIRNRRSESNWRKFENDEIISGIPEWCFLKEQNWLFNGSLTATGVPPTKIKLKRILELAILVYSGEAKYLRCRQDKSQCKKCQDYMYGYHHCRNERLNFLRSGKNV